MTNKQVKRKARQVIEILEPALKRDKGNYLTGWGKKTQAGVVTTIFNVIAYA